MSDSDLILHGPKEPSGPARSLGELFIDTLSGYGDAVTQIQLVDGVEVSVTYSEPSCSELLRHGKVVAGLLRQHGLGSGDTVDGVEVSVTYSELLRHGKVVAGLLRQHGLGSGDTVMLCCGNTLEVAPIMLGTLFIGAALAPVNPGFVLSDTLHMINVIKPQLCICNEQAASTVQEALTQYNTPVQFITMEAVSKRLKENPDVKDFYLGKVDDPDSHVAFVMCSSGTTGKPKGVERSHGRLYRELANDTLFKSGGSAMNISGPSWISGVMANLVNFSCNNTLVLLQKFEVERYLKTIQQFKVNYVILSPDHVVPLAKYDSYEKYDLSSIKRVIYAGAPMSRVMLEAAGKRLNNTYVGLGYGMTETLNFLRGTGEDIGKPGNVGKLAPNASGKVVDLATGQSLGPNSQGELCFMNPFSFIGYRGNAQATADIFDEDGFLHTGDVGYYDQDGYFYVIDRCKELFKHCGIHVPAGDIEEVLLQHVDVIEAAVVAIDHDVDTTHATAFVVRRPGAKVTEQELVKMVEESLPSYKWLLGGAHFIDDLPKTFTGKVKKFELRQTFKKSCN